MTPENFCYWLWSQFELSDVKSFDETKTQVIKDHLGLVFRKETPVRIKIDGPKMLERLNKDFNVEIHKTLEQEIKDILNQNLEDLPVCSTIPDRANVLLCSNVGGPHVSC
jgi:hypothetical protein